MKNDTNSVLAKLGYKALHNFDFIMAGLCLTFALSARPFMTSFYEKPLENANARYEEVYKQADSVYRTAQGVSAPEDSTLNMYLYNRREQSDAARELSDEFRSARVGKERAQEMYNFSSIYGYTCGGLLGATGLLLTGIAVAGRRRDKNAPATP